MSAVRGTVGGRKQVKCEWWPSLSWTSRCHMSAVRGNVGGKEAHVSVRGGSVSAGPLTATFRL